MRGRNYRVSHQQAIADEVLALFHAPPSAPWMGAEGAGGKARGAKLALMSTQLPTLLTYQPFSFLLDSDALGKITRLIDIASA
jgi:hypothetical protein